MRQRLSHIQNPSGLMSSCILTAHLVYSSLWCSIYWVIFLMNWQQVWAHSFSADSTPPGTLWNNAFTKVNNAGLFSPALERNTQTNHSGLVWQILTQRKILLHWFNLQKRVINSAWVKDITVNLKEWGLYMKRRERRSQKMNGILCSSLESMWSREVDR